MRWRVLLWRNGGVSGKMYFPVGTAASNLLQQDDIFLDKIHILSKNVAVGERINIYTSTDTGGKAKIAFGHVKLVLHITRIDDHTVRVIGLAKDVYNFENMKYGDSLTNMKFDRDFF